MSCGFCVCVCVNKQGTWEDSNEKRQISWIKSVYDTMGIRGLFTDYFKYTSAYIGFWSKVFTLSMKRITEALRPPIRPFSARSYNRLSHADVILLDPSFLLGACTAPYLVGKAGSTFVRNVGAWLFFCLFFSLIVHPFPISTLVITLLIQKTKVSLSSFFINQIHLRFALALTFKTQQKNLFQLYQKRKFIGYILYSIISNEDIKQF